MAQKRSTLPEAAKALSIQDGRKRSPEAASAESAFEALFAEHWGGLVRLLTRLVGSPAEAEDLALETFLRLYRRMDAGATGLNTGGWLRRVATNLGLNTIRGWQRRERYELASGREALEDGRTATPAELFAREEDRRRARQVLAEMRPRQAQLLVLRYSGASYQEIASALDVSPASIGPLLARAEREFERRYRLANPEVD